MLATQKLAATEKESLEEDKKVEIAMIKNELQVSLAIKPA